MRVMTGGSGVGAGGAGVEECVRRRRGPPNHSTIKLAGCQAPPSLTAVSNDFLTHPSSGTKNAASHASAGTMLGQRRRRWPNIVPSLYHRFLLGGAAAAAHHAGLFTGGE